MQRFKKVQDIVKHILETQPDTRSDDDLLLAKVCEYMNKDCRLLPFCTVLMNRKRLGLPSIKSVERSRRKLQRVYPELSANDTIEAVRDLEEENYKKYAKAVKV